jgi:hypothetical protein
MQSKVKIEKPKDGPTELQVGDWYLTDVNELRQVFLSNNVLHALDPATGDCYPLVSTALCGRTLVDVTITVHERR